MSVATQVLRAAEMEASKHGASISLASGSKHTILVVSLGDQSRKFTIDLRSSTKTKQKCDWARQNIRRIVKELLCNTAKPSK